jgi:hypothetical protein
VDRHRNVAFRTPLVQPPQSIETTCIRIVPVVVGRDSLVGRVDLDPVEGELLERGFDLGVGVVGNPRIEAAEGEDAVGCRVAKRRSPLVGVVSVPPGSGSRS